MEKLSFVSLVGCVLAFSAPGMANADDDVQEMAAMSSKFGLISADEAGKKALEAKPGVVKEIDIDGRNFDKGFDYEVEIVDANGKEWEVTLDAKTGKVSKMEQEWF